MAADSELLASYARDRSQEAINELIRRHIDLVYASARRQMGNAESAEDVTQAVFIMLATKAATLRADVIVSAWLLTATWYACKNAQRKEHRRRIHEREASLMRRETAEEAVPADPAVGAALDEALVSLREADRSAVVMHYLQGRTFNEVAEALRTTPEAARKRTERALVKLRMQLTGRAIEMAAPSAVGMYLLAAASAKAPAGLLAQVTTGMTAGRTANALAQISLKSMAAAGNKFAAAVAATLVLLAGATVALYATTSRSRVTTGNTAPAAATTLPTSPLIVTDDPQIDAPGGDAITFPNAALLPIASGNLTQYAYDQDASVTRLPGGEPSAVISSQHPNPGPMPGLRGWAIPATAWRAKRIALSAHLRTQDVRESVGITVMIWAAQNRLLAQDMEGWRRRITGTRDWTRISSVLDVPTDAERIEFGIGLVGPGRVWIDSFTIQPVSSATPTTSDAVWHLSTPFPSKFALTSDPSQPRNGHATARLESAGAGVAESARLVRVDWALDHMRSKRVRVSAMIKAEDVARGAGVVIVAGSFDAQRRYTKRSAKDDRPVRGTTGWLRYAATLDVPADADMLEYGIRLEGPGTIWIDDVVLEVLP